MNTFQLIKSFFYQSMFERNMDAGGCMFILLYYHIFYLINVDFHLLNLLQIFYFHLLNLLRII